MSITQKILDRVRIVDSYSLSDQSRVYRLNMVSEFSGVVSQHYTLDGALSTLKMQYANEMKRYLLDDSYIRLCKLFYEMNATHRGDYANLNWFNEQRAILEALE